MEAGSRICVLGNFSGRNAGDIAILAGLIRDIEARFESPRFFVPTIDPRFIREHVDRKGNVEPVSLLPWALSAKIFGLPVLHAALCSDVVLITDNILFDRRLWNPLYNYLSTLSVVLPIAARRGVPVVLYNASLGPIDTAMGRRCLRRLIRVCPLVILRDRPSAQLLESLDVPHAPPHFAADCALSTTPAPEAQINRVVHRLGLFEHGGGTIAFNVNSYLDVFLNAEGRHRDVPALLGELARSIDAIVGALDVAVLLIVTQVMDLKVAEPLHRRLARQDRVKLICNREHDYDELSGVMARCELLVGMRTHSLILAASVGTPVVGIVSYPKTVGFMQSIEQDRWLIGFDELNAATLTQRVREAYDHRHQTREALRRIIPREKRRAAHGADLLHEHLNDKAPATPDARPATDDADPTELSA